MSMAKGPFRRPKWRDDYIPTCDEWLFWWSIKCDQDWVVDFFDEYTVSSEKNISEKFEQIKSSLLALKQDIESETKTSLQSYFNQLIMPDWQEWAPSLLFGAASTGQEMSTRPGGYRVLGNHCDWWITASLTARGTAEGVMTLTGPPPPPLGNARFGVTVVSTTGVNTDGRGLTAVLNGGVISFFKGQDTGEPANAVTDRDVEDAASISLSGWYQIEDED
ncbi:hypothetical protein [Bombella apis]|uniref:Uncharacterized protein n=1 Tax=Bombella apis TaxID=1785988 RepID=A0ABR9MP58_9PROT|nr:hypothetical protein [Bombella apis]MBE1723181.1 hypothetical protein [Bombella apis]MBR9730988.1 hypothetical protein [Bombella apis]